MICSSLNRLCFIVRLLPGDGLYPLLEEFSGLRSTQSSAAGCKNLHAHRLRACRGSLSPAVDPQQLPHSPARAGYIRTPLR